MRYWLVAIAAVALAIAGGWFVVLNQHEVAVHVTPSRMVAVPLGAALAAVLAFGAGSIGLLAVGGALARGWRRLGRRRRARREARGREALARGRDLVWTGETSAARAELRRAAELPDAEAARLVLLAETHLQEGDAHAAREVLERAPAALAGDPRLLEVRARTAEALDNPAMAIDALERAHRAAPGSPRLAARLRDLYAAAGRWPEAAALQAEVLLHVRAPALLAAERERLVALRYEAAVMEADAARGARQLRGLARETPGFIPAWVSAGDRYAQTGYAAAARRTWRRGLRHRAAAVLVDRIEAHDAAAGQPQRTTRVLRALARRHRGDHAATLRLARHLLARGDVDAAAAALAALPEHAGRAADALHAEVARARGDLQGAADAYARALGPGLGLTGAWRCLTCGGAADRWTARCAACGRWDTLRSSLEEPDRMDATAASDALIRPAN